MGPFAIFSGQADSREESPPSFDFALDDTMLDIPGPDHQRLLGDGMTDLDTSNVPFIHDIDTIVESAGLDLIPSSDFLYPNQPTSPLLPKSPTPPSPHLGLPIPLFQDPQTSTLMYHYMNHVAELLQPVLHPSNPWRTTYFPFALEGCPELFLSQGSTPSSHASIALFHSLLSSAAFHLRNATPDSKQFHQLGLQHRTKSLHALNAALVYPNDAQLYTVYLTAMLSLVTIDVSVTNMEFISNKSDYNRRRC